MLFVAYILGKNVLCSFIDIHLLTNQDLTVSPLISQSVCMNVTCFVFCISHVLFSLSHTDYVSVMTLLLQPAVNMWFMGKLQVYLQNVMLQG